MSSIAATMNAAPDTDARFLAALEAHRGILYKVARAYGRSAADREDIVQETVVQLWRAFPKYDPAYKFSTWMYRIAVNVAITHYRSERRRIRDTVPLEDYGLDIAAADALFDDAGDNIRALRQMINGLDELNRALILLFLEGFSSEEIADVVGISASNVSTRINRLKIKLQTEFNAQKEGIPA